MPRVQRMLSENWAMPTSVLLHGAVLAAIIFTLAPVPVQIGEKAVPVTLVNLVRPAAPPPPPVPVAEPTPPPIATTAPEVQETIPPPKKVPPKHEIKKPVPQPEVTNIDPSPLPPAPQASEMPVQPPQAAAPPPTYLSLLFSKLESNKVYPHEARIRKEQGTAVLRFVIDRNGHVLTHKLDKGSGHGDLDQEVEQMLERSEPFPPMPAEMTQAQLELVVPIQFSLR